MNRESLHKELSAYTSPYIPEQNFIEPFLKLLNQPRAFYRDHFLPGHITGSAWIINLANTHVLLTHHAKLAKWLQPGGHAEGDENIINVAKREAEEETGLKEFAMLSSSIFDIDIHTIPARKDLPEHLHFDIRFIFQADQQSSLTITPESTDLAWIPITEIPTITEFNQSMIRMAEKTTRLLGSQ